MINNQYERNLTARKCQFFERLNDERAGGIDFPDSLSLEMKTDLVPAWFQKALGDKFNIVHDV